MIIFNKNLLFSLSSAAVLSLAISGCDSNSDNDPEPPPPPPPVVFSFDVQVINLTNNQPLSPVVLIAHQTGNIWTINQSASVELELMAESGDNSSLTAVSFAMASSSGAGPIGPGGSETISLSINNSIASTFLSVATMLVNTNDAFTGIDQLDISQFSVGQSQMMNVAAYDAGTEANSEMMGTIPGPADGGEGMNTSRDDVDFVSRHSGVVTSDFGLTASILNESHRFDNPVAKIIITRTQ